MKAVLQRVSSAAVSADGTERGTISSGLCILLGVVQGDTEEDASLLCDKILKLRIFSDENGKMNRSVIDSGGDVIIVSNFTLCADYSHGNRPDYFGAAAPNSANELYEYFIKLVRGKIPQVVTGIFGADMALSIVNDGPVTIIIDSDVLRKKKS